MMGFLLQRNRRFLILFLIVLLIAIVLSWMIPSFVAAYRTAFVISHIVPAVPEWFEWGRYEIETQEVSLDDNRIVDIYLPVRRRLGEGGPQGMESTSFVLFFPGFTPEGSRDPRIVNLARSFAGAGIGVAVPDSEHIRKAQFSRQDIDLIKDTFHFLQEQPYVDSERIGMSGFSVAGSYILRAASELGDQPLFVHSLGGYYDLGELLAELVSERAIYKGKERAWEPGSFAKEILRKTLSAQIGQEHAQQLLTQEISLEEARKRFESFPDDFLTEFRDISPASSLSHIKTRVFLMHDTNDNTIPVEESRKIRDALPQGISISYNEFLLLEHVTPQAFLSLDILKLSRQVLQIMRLLL